MSISYYLVDDKWTTIRFENIIKPKFYDEYGDVLKNKYVQFNVNGTDYPVRTNDQGIATLNINLGIGEYNITSISLFDERKSNTLLIFSL